VIRREVSIGYGALHSSLKVHGSHRMRNGPGENSPGPSQSQQEV
jgi:hypothetical protein